jgi:hypothetical protein
MATYLDCKGVRYRVTRNTTGHVLRGREILFPESVSEGAAQQAAVDDIERQLRQRSGYGDASVFDVVTPGTPLGYPHLNVRMGLPVADAESWDALGSALVLIEFIPVEQEEST